MSTETQEPPCPFKSSSSAEPLYSSLASDPDLGDLVTLYVDEMPERVAHLVSLWQSQDGAELRRFAHQIKGAAGSYGFDCITRSAARLEAALQQSASEEQIFALLDDLKSLCLRAHAGTP